jgi:glycosyltransferase involved in cell wall biosynthesis
LEIIVADDGSDDNTENVIFGVVQQRQIPYIRYLKKQNGGIAHTRNFLLHHAKGELLAWVDADDRWAADKLTKQLEYLRQNPDCEIVFSKFENFYEHPELKENPRFQHEEKYAERTSFHFTTSLARRSVFEKTGDFMIATGEDLEIVSRMMTRRINVNHCIPETLYYRRLHGLNSIITMDYNVKKIIFPNMIRNLRQKITEK